MPFQDVQNKKYGHESLSTKIIQVPKVITLMYNKLIGKKRLTPESSRKKWIEDFCLPTNDHINWTAAYRLA